MPNHRKVGIAVDDLRYSWRDEPKSISPSSVVLLVVFVCAAAFLMGMVWFRPWADDGASPEVQASPPAEAQAPEQAQVPAAATPPPQAPASGQGAPAGP
jgi:hypothetical protein